MLCFVKIKSSRIGEITLSFTDIGKSRACREFSTLKIYVLALLFYVQTRKFIYLIIHMELSMNIHEAKCYATTNFLTVKGIDKLF